MTALQVHESDAMMARDVADQRSATGNKKDAVRYRTKSANSYVEAACMTKSREQSVSFLLRARKQLQKALDEVDEFLKQER